MGLSVLRGPASCFQDFWAAYPLPTNVLVVVVVLNAPRGLREVNNTFSIMRETVRGGQARAM